MFPIRSPGSTGNLFHHYAENWKFHNDFIFFFTGNPMEHAMSVLNSISIILPLHWWKKHDAWFWWCVNLLSEHTNVMVYLKRGAFPYIRCNNSLILLLILLHLCYMDWVQFRLFFMLLLLILTWVQWLFRGFDLISILHDKLLVLYQGKQISHRASWIAFKLVLC